MLPRSRRLGCKQRTLSELLKSTPAAWSEKYHYSSAAQEASSPRASSPASGSSTGATTRTPICWSIRRTREPRAVPQSPRRLAPSGVSVTRRAGLSSVHSRQHSMRSCWTRSRSAAAQESRPWHGKASSSRSRSRNTLEADGSGPDAGAVKVRLVFNSENRQRLTHQNDQGSADQGAGQLYGQRRGHR